ncbi:family 78 glycoside hydrolase catalytic domain [Roseburia hominis]
MKIEKIKINGMKNPVGFSFDNLRCAWVVADTTAKKTVNVKIDVSEDKDFENVLFSREGAELNSACEVLAVPLKPRTRYYVRVAVTGDNKERAASTAYFETAKMEETWLGKWIKPKKEDKFHPVFEKEFSAKEDLIKARLYISGLGLYAARLNGKKVSGEILTPYYSDYRTEVQYQTYDITGMIKAENRIRVELGNGWYKGYFGLAGTDKNFGDEFQMIAEIHLCYADGTEEIVASDESWFYFGSDTEESDIYNGEIVNRCVWEGKENPKRKPIPGGIAPAVLAARYSLPVIEHEDMPVKEVIHTPAGETVLDFGQNFAGYVTFHSNLKKGTKVVLDFGEILQKGNFYNANYRRAKAQFTYISDGQEELVKPQFTYFGFRYVRVTGWEGEVDPYAFVAKALYSDMEITGHIETGRENVNKLFSNVMWGQKSNSIDFPTDCPQRDERLGWTGEAQIFAGTACYNMDTAAFYNKFIHDLRVEQEKLDGIMPGVIPVFDPAGAAFAAVWGDIATFLPTVVYEHYGDKKALENYYPMMKDWVDKITKEDKARGQRYLFDYGNQMGDWLGLDGRTKQSMKGGTDDYFIGSCYYAMSTKMVADAARTLNYSEDAVYYDELYRHIYEAVLREYFTESGRLSIDTQRGYLVALYSGIYRDKDRVVKGLKERLYKDCYKMKGGFVGSPIMCKVMADNNLEEEAFYFLLQKGYPGWMHCIDLGATTIWERWNSVLDDGTMSGTMMNSLNHYAYGSVVEFLYKNVAGIRALEPGFKKVQISPLINQKLKYVKVSYDSVYGTYRVEWKIKKDGRVHVTIEVPFGCTALVGFPFYPGEATGELTAGVYEFEYKPTEDLRCRYTKKTLFKEMVQDEKAMEIIERVSPMLAAFPVVRG